MAKQHHNSEWMVTAFCYRLGLLSEAETDAFQAHLDSGCDDCAANVSASESMAEMLALSVEEIAPGAQVRERLMSRIHALTAPAPPGFDILRASAANWQPTGVPGVSTRPLAAEKSFKTFLIKFEPGAVFPAHPHHGVEHCYVISGDIRSGELELAPDDFQRAASKTRHAKLHSQNGCVLLITTTDPDEFTSR